MSSPPTGTYVLVPGNRVAVVARQGVLQMANGERQLLCSCWLPAKPIAFDRQITDLGHRDEWALARLSRLSPNTPTQVWREALGAMPVLVACERLGSKAQPLRNAFGIYDLHTQGQLVDWALQLRSTCYDDVRSAALQFGIGPVLAALELAGSMDMYAMLAKEHGVECSGGLAWR